MRRLSKRSNVANHDWHALADEALEKARKLPHGPERSEALKKAGQLRVAADIKRALSIGPKS